jgi:uncharacterized protein (TIGR00730 family)
MIRTITAYCGSSDRIHPDFINAAYQMGAAIAQHGFRLAYGAGKTGLMGALADGALQSGGEVVGIVPGLLNKPQLVHSQITTLQVVDSMHQRKAALAEIGDAFIALPGGLGTFDEFFEILVWSQIGLHRKPIGLLNTRAFFQPFFELIEHAAIEGMLYKEHQDLFVCADLPDALINKLIQFQVPDGMEQWVDRDDLRE